MANASNPLGFGGTDDLWELRYNDIAALADKWAAQTYHTQMLMQFLEGGLSESITAAMEIVFIDGVGYPVGPYPNIDLIPHVEQAGQGLFTMVQVLDRMRSFSDVRNLRFPEGMPEMEKTEALNANKKHLLSFFDGVGNIINTAYSLLDADSPFAPLLEELANDLGVGAPTIRQDIAALKNSPKVAALKEATKAAAEQMRATAESLGLDTSVPPPQPDMPDFGFGR